MPTGMDWKRSLQAEFCPPLDTALVVALLDDYDHEGETDEDIVCFVREQLSLLAASAIEQQANDLTEEDLDALRLSSRSATTETSTDRGSSLGSTSPESSSTGCTSTSSDTTASFSSALSFLRASFPNVPTHILKERLQAEHAAGDFDMQHLVEDLLSEEHIRDLEERGLSDESSSDNPDDWTTVARISSRKAKTVTFTSKKVSKAKGKGKTIVVNDVRQQRQNMPRLSTHSAGDPWSQVLSISSYLSNILPRPQTFFSSYFHKPEYSDPSSALRAALYSMKQLERQDVETQTILETMIEFIADSPEYGYEDLTPAQKSQLCNDVKLCLEAAKGSPEAALDVFKLLRELDEDSTGSMGLYHTPATSSQIEIPFSSPTRAKNTIPPMPIIYQSRESSPLKSPTRAQTAVAQTSTTWEDVPVRPKPPNVHPLAEHIPAYNSANVPRKKSKRPPVSAKLSSTVPGSGYRNASVLGGYRTQIEEARNKHDEMLRMASRHWNTGSGKNRGGEVALYYALEAQKLQAEARNLQLDAMRAHVNSRRQSSTQNDTIDVHYCTTSEALTIVREVLAEGWVVQSRPLHIITGRGLHSTGGVAILAPAIKIALEQDGWAITTWNGGLSVRGRM